MQIQRIGFTAPSFCSQKMVTPKIKDEKAAYDTMYKYFSDYYSDCDPDYGDADDPTAVRNLIAANRELAEKARILKEETGVVPGLAVIIVGGGTAAVIFMSKKKKK